MKDKETVKNFILTEYAKNSKAIQHRFELYRMFTSLPRQLFQWLGILSLARRIRNKVKPFCGAKCIAFGGDSLYQSFPMLGLKGQRSTELRMETYGLLDILTRDMEVLDIGCNIGFFDMTLASHVKSVLGVEYNENLVNIATQVAEMLEIPNVAFVAGDFKEWYKKNDRKYDVVLSFAIHGWLNITPERYAEMLADLLLPGGYLIFESHPVDFQDGSENFSKLLDASFQIGFVKYSEGEFMDDFRRRWTILRKC